VTTTFLRDDYAGAFDPSITIASFTRRALARLGREWLLIGHLQDRVGMPLVLALHSPDDMAAVAIDEWMGASPIYSARTQRTLNFHGNDVTTIFKNIQLDIGAPHQFMDFRYKVSDPRHGEFWLDHCGALMDVEPMGEDYVRRMCHDIEDPTFDATAAAAHPCAKIRPIHRPPRVPADRAPHCHWSVTIDESTEPYAQHANLDVLARSRLADIELVDPGVDAEAGGWADYSGDFEPDFGLEDLGHRALVLSLQEVAVQTHLLARAFLTCVAQRWGEAEAAQHNPEVFAGVAGIGAERIRGAMGIDTDDAAAIAKVLQLHPVFHPRTYVTPGIDLQDEHTVRLALRDAPCFAEDDEHSWLATFERDDASSSAIDAIAQTVNRCARSRRVAPGTDERHAFVITIDPANEPAPLLGPVSLARLSTGATVTFTPRRLVRP